jgi:hypothetical protein
MKNFTLKFGKYKGQDFLSTPQSYQTWLTSQDWFKMPSTEVKYDVVRKFVSEYIIGMGKRYEIVMEGLSFEDAEQYKDAMNIHELNDITDYFFVQYSKFN